MVENRRGIDSHFEIFRDEWRVVGFIFGNGGTAVTQGEHGEEEKDATNDGYHAEDKDYSI